MSAVLKTHLSCSKLGSFGFCALVGTVGTSPNHAERPREAAAQLAITTSPIATPYVEHARGERFTKDCRVMLSMNKYTWSEKIRLPRHLPPCPC